VLRDLFNAAFTGTKDEEEFSAEHGKERTSLSFGKTGARKERRQLFPLT